MLIGRDAEDVSVRRRVEATVLRLVHGLSSFRGSDECPISQASSA
jgi:hypothetical protein